MDFQTYIIITLGFVYGKQQQNVRKYRLYLIPNVDFLDWFSLDLCASFLNVGCLNP